MKFTYFQQRFGRLHGQRNALLALVVVLLTVNVLQTVLLCVKREKTIIVPPELRQEFWVAGNRFAPSYLEEMGLFFTHLLLDVSPCNIMAQGEIVLRYVDSAFYGDFRRKLLEDEGRLKKDNLSLVFTPVHCEVFPGAMALEITGDLSSYMASKKVATHRERYRLEFTHHYGRLHLKRFVCIQSDQQDVEDTHA